MWFSRSLRKPGMRNSDASFLDNRSEQIHSCPFFETASHGMFNLYLCCGLLRRFLLFIYVWSNIINLVHNFLRVKSASGKKVMRQGKERGNSSKFSGKKRGKTLYKSWRSWRLYDMICAGFRTREKTRFFLQFLSKSACVKSILRKHKFNGNYWIIL